MKTRLLINSLAAMASVIYAVFFISCEEEVYNIYIPEQEKPTADTLFTRAVETGPTNDCPYGSYLFEQYKNGVLALELSICKDSAKYILLPGDTIPVFIHDTVTEIRVDTVISIIHDTIIKVVHDTVTNIRIDTVSVMDTLKIVEVDTVTLIKTDTLIITELDTVTVTKTDTLVKKIYIHHKSQCEDFNTGSSPDYWEKGWFDENASESDKVNRYFFNPGNTAITGLPKFWKPCAVDFIKFLYGSRLPYKIEVILEDDKGLWHIIKRIDYPGKSCFDKYNHDDYESISIKPQTDYVYLVNRIFIRAIKLQGVCYTEYTGDIESNNNQLNIDNLCWGWSWTSK